MRTFMPDDMGAGQIRIVSVIQGDYRVSSDPNVVFSTVLGSCVSVALYDPEAKVGGMNHYLLPYGAEGQSGGVKYGAMANELLVNELLKSGASRGRLRAKLCGGATIISSLGDIGTRNAEFAREFMRREGFRVVAEDLGGRNARRLQFHPTSGDAKVFAVPAQQTRSIAEREKTPKLEIKTEVTLF